MKDNKDLVKQLNELLIRASKVYKGSSLDKFSKLFTKIDSLSQFSKIPISKKTDFYNFSSQKKYSYLKKSRRDELGNEPILPLTKKDYWNYVESEIGRFKAMGVKKTDNVSVVDFTINETIPIVNCFIQMGVSYVVTEGEVLEIVKDIKSKNINVIFTHYRMLDKILKCVEENNYKLNLRLVIATAEPVESLSVLRKKIKKLLGANLIDTIGTREIGGYAYECKEKNYYHFLDSLYVETINAKGETNNGVGELLITPLWRKDFPLIRYATKDLLEIKEKTCNCKVKNNFVFKKVEGRLDENVKISSSMIDLRKIFFRTKEIIHYQNPLIDKLLWRIFPAINFVVILTKEGDVDVLLILIDKLAFNSYFRRKKNIFDQLANEFKVGVEIVLLPKELLNNFSKDRYLDIRYNKRKISKRLLKSLKGYSSFF